MEIGVTSRALAPGPTGLTWPAQPHWPPHILVQIFLLLQTLTLRPVQATGSSVSLLEDVCVGGAGFGSWVACFRLPDPALPWTGPEEVGWGSGLEPGQLLARLLWDPCNILYLSGS